MRAIMIDRVAGLKALMIVRARYRLSINSFQAAEQWAGMEDWERQSIMDTHEFFNESDAAKAAKEDTDEG